MTCPYCGSRLSAAGPGWELYCCGYQETGNAEDPPCGYQAYDGDDQ